MIAALILLFALLVGHVIADYPLQGDFLSKAKNRAAPIPGVPWYQALGAHALIHGGMVALILATLVSGLPLWFVVALGLSEAFAHALIDDTKCTGGLSFNGDQCWHAFCKCWWVVAAMLFPG